MKNLVSFKIERELVDKAKSVVKEREPLRFPISVKDTEAVREALIFYVESNQKLLQK